jgi:type II secretory pathway pseudopilin PulG
MRGNLRRRRAAGLTRIEALLTASILLLLGAVSYPRWRGKSLARKEAAAVKILSAIAAAAKARASAEGLPPDSIGALDVPRLRGAWAPAEGILEAEGYLFRLTQRPRPEGAASAPAAGYVILAWPLEYGRSGNAAFWMDETGTGYETRNGRRRYGGLESPLPVTAAEVPPDPTAAGPRKTRRFGADAEEWRPFVPPVRRNRGGRS